MKLKKFKYLLSIGATALAIAPIASLTINANNNAIVKTNVANNSEESQEASPASTVTPITQPENGTIDPATLSPAGNDLYNEYNFADGYIVKDLTNKKISFYNWFKQEVWSITVDNTLIANFPTDKEITSMNVKGALTDKGAYDTKLFVYGNFGEKAAAAQTAVLVTETKTDSTTGSYLFELDMINGTYIQNSLITNTTGTDGSRAQNEIPASSSEGESATNGKTTLISDINQLTVIDNNTLVVTSPFNNTDNNNNKSAANAQNNFYFNVSIITLNSDTAPTVSSQTVTLGGVNGNTQQFGATMGEVLGVIKKDNNYLFAVSYFGSDNGTDEQNTVLSVFFLYFSADSSSNALSPANFSETGAFNNAAGSTFWDNAQIATISPASIKSGSSNGTGINIQDYQNYLDTHATNFSVVYSGGATDPQMYISLNWDSTDLTPNVNSTTTTTMVTSYNKVISATFKAEDSNNTPVLGTYSLNAVTSGGPGTLTYLGISNLVSTRVDLSANQDGSNISKPYAVAVASGASGGQTTLYFNVAPLETLSNNTGGGGSGIDNTATYASSGKWYNSKDVYNTTTTTSSSTNNKMDWQLQFIPTTNLDNPDNFYGYITTGIENDGSVSYNENFFSIQKTNTSYAATDYGLVDYQFGITDTELKQIYKPAASTDKTLSPNSFATETTKNAIIADLAQVLSYKVSEDSNKTVSATSTTDGKLNITTSQITNQNTQGLVVNSDAGTITGSISYDVPNWWNNKTTTITIPVDLQLSKGSDFSTANLASSVSQGDNSVADWLQAKYSFDSLFPTGSTSASDQLVSFVKDILNTASLGSATDNQTLRTILINSLPNSSTTPTEGDGQEAGSQGNGSGGQEEGEVAAKSVKLQAEEQPATTDAAIQVGSYISVTPDNTNKKATVSIDLSSATGLTANPVTMDFQNFSGTLDPSSEGYTNYDAWSGHQSPAEEQTGNNTSQTTNDNSSSSLSGGAIAGIIIAVLVVIALIIGIYFFVKKRKNIQ